ncbi:MAG: arylsulfotransferase family protein [Chitinophagales bacterium]
MNLFSSIVLTLFLNLFFAGSIFAQFEYISPKPNSLYHNPETNIILKSGSEMDQHSLKTELVQITGSISGVHAFKIVLSSDQKTILFYPTVKFEFDETVTVIIADGFKIKSGEEVKGTSFTFQIHPARDAATIEAIHLAGKHIREEEYGNELSSTDSGNGAANKLQPDCIYPELEITSTGNEYNAPVFMRNQRLNDNICFSRHIASNEGDSLYAVFDEFAGSDFKINYNGYLTYFDKGDSTFVMMDSAYNEIKKFHMGNGYPCDEHEFLVYPNGHSFLMSYDPQIIDMSVIVSGGATDAVVSGLVIQELDENDNVIFQWRSWDYLEITDAVMQVCLTCLEIDYVHGNSIDIDVEGNLLVSCRHLSAILKINRSTGDIIWQMGGENNEFTFINDPGPTHFYYQHHFRLLPDGNYSMFNNANYQIPQASGAKIFSLDQVTKTATLVWEYVHPKVVGYNEAFDYYVYGRAMGSVQLLPNGNWLIGWGLLTNPNFAPYPNVSEVDSAGNIVWELRYTDSTLVSYRAFKFDFIRCGYIADSSLMPTFVGSDSVDLSWDNSNNATSYIFQYKSFGATDWITMALSTNSVSLNGLIPQTVYEWRVQGICDAYNDSSAFTATHVFNTIFDGIVNASVKKLLCNIYPNPATLQTSVTVYLPERGKLKLVVINLLGEIVYQNEPEAIAGKNLFTIPVGFLPRGIYTVQIATSQSQHTEQLVIQ